MHSTVWAHDLNNDSTWIHNVLSSTYTFSSPGSHSWVVGEKMKNHIIHFVSSAQITGVPPSFLYCLRVIASPFFLWYVLSTLTSLEERATKSGRTHAIRYLYNVKRSKEKYSQEFLVPCKWSEWGFLLFSQGETGLATSTEILCWWLCLGNAS